ncbi:MAG: DUF5723 family protein [Phaeodactylibacter sp.]|uniref:DUF5723 family protein n=1 Tax=Phaeodactylibacter sp. TaxID=1940289 RepID=UPI0032EC435C
MYRLVVVTAFLLVVSTLPAQEYGLYQMRDVWNATHLNPGFFPRQEFVFSLPSVHTSLNAIGINQERLFEYNSTENTNYLNLDGVVGELERDLILKNSTIIDGLGLGGRIGKFFVSLSTSTVADTKLTLPEALLRTVWEGTENYLDQPLDIGPAMDMMAYQKIGLGVNYEVTPRLAVGVRVNRLLGGASFVTDRSSLVLTQSSDVYQTTAAMNYRVFYYGAGQFNLLDQTIEGFENFGDALDEDGVEPENGNGLRQFTNRNNGWSVDLGGEYLMGDRLTFSASLLNLGSIKWENATQQINLTGTVNFEGVDAVNLDDGEDFEVIPGIDTVGTFEAVSNVGYTQALAPRTYLGANYQLFPFWDVGGLLYNEFFAGGTFTALSLSTRFSLGRIMSLGGMYTLQNGTFNSFGANAALKLGPLQVYAIADNLSSVVNQERLDGTNFRAGLNLTFGRKKSDLKLAAARGLDAEMPDPVNLPSAPVVADSKPATELPTPDDGANEEERLEETISPVPEPSVAENTKPETTAPSEELTESAPSDLLTAPSDRSEEVYPENHPANSEGLKLFPFRLELRDNEDLGLIEEATVDIFRIEEGGYFKLIRTDEAFGGRVNLQLTAERAPYQAVVKSSGYDSLFVDFEPGRKSELHKVVFLVKPEAQAAAAPETAAEEVSATPVPEAAVPEEPESPVIDKPEVAEPKPELSPVVPAEILEPEPEPEPIPEPKAPAPEPKPQPIPEPDAPQDEGASEAADTRFPETLQPPYITYLLTQRTSLREEPNSTSRVISRMPVGTELKLLEETNEWWWKVSMGGWDGYVKASLLKLRD